MAVKEYVKITPEGLNLLTVLDYSRLSNSFYGSNVFFTNGFSGDPQYLLQSLGNIGAFARERDFDKDVSIIIIANSIMENPDSELSKNFVSDLGDKLNQNNSPYRKLKLITENHLIWYLENRVKTNNDELIDDLLKKYKDSKNKPRQQSLF